LISSAPGGASVVLTPAWRFAYLDVAAEGIFRRPVEELLSRSIWEAIPELRESRLFAVLRTAAEQRVSLSFEEPNWINGGHLLVHVQPVDDGLFVTFVEETRMRLVPEGQRDEAHPDEQQKQDTRHQDV